MEVDVETKNLIEFIFPDIGKTKQMKILARNKEIIKAIYIYKAGEYLRAFSRKLL